MQYSPFVKCSFFVEFINCIMFDLCSRCVNLTNPLLAFSRLNKAIVRKAEDRAIIKREISITQHSSAELQGEFLFDTSSL